MSAYDKSGNEPTAVQLSLKRRYSNNEWHAKYSFSKVCYRRPVRHGNEFTAENDGVALPELQEARPGGAQEGRCREIFMEAHEAGQH